MRTLVQKECGLVRYQVKQKKSARLKPLQTEVQPCPTPSAVKRPKKTNILQITKRCERCGKLSTVFTAYTRFCSKQCTNYAYKDKLRQAKIEAYKEMDEDSKPTRGGDNFDSDGNQGSAKSRPESVISSKEFLTPTEAARLLGLSRSTVYRYLASNALRCAQFKGKTLIRRRDIDSLFDPPHDYQKRQEKERAPITEFYTTAEIVAKYNVSTGHIFNIAKTENIPKVFSRGRNLWSKKHIDKYFARRAPDEEITEWYSVRDIQKKFGMTPSAIYSFVYTLAIPKKKVRREVFYSKKHFDIAKGIARCETKQYYTVQEATEKYHITRDQLYHYVKRYSIPKQQKGRYVKISRKELDALFAPVL